MAEQEKTVWQTMAQVRWRGWTIVGNGRFAVSDIENGGVSLFAFHMEAEEFRRKRVGTRKIYLMDHAPAPQQQLAQKDDDDYNGPSN